ncbi:hypothetical protein [Kangiella sp. TOML190]|uniref:hypothetical protein n=1 Tax=Kangiella sp. TOML190 TaxID=2931351 RepID=UPI00203C1E47|nr:hypothetical protein [Kangiella sp. TOML190]
MNDCYEIVPGKQISGIQLGNTISDIEKAFSSIKKSNNDIAFTGTKFSKYFVENLSFIYDENQKKIISISCRDDYQGSYQGISLGDTLKELQDKFPDIYWDDVEEMVLIESIEGIGFTCNDHGSNPFLDLESKIVQISIW